MKAQKKLNLILITLIIVLISIISFVGIFYQNKNEMKDRIPDYTLGTDLDGYRRAILAVKAEDESNKADVLKYENYIKSAGIIKKRLESMKVNDYTVRVDEATGQIEITLPENAQTDYILSDIIQKGVFEIKDNSNSEILMNNKEIKSVDVQKNEAYTGATSIYMNINFNSEGSKKFKDITKKYQNVITNTTTNETSNETANTNEAANTVSNEATNEVAGETKEPVKVELLIDGSSMMETTFSEIIDNGVLALTLGNSSSESEIETLVYQAESLAAVLENEPLPIQYEITGNIYISSPIEKNHIKILIGVEIAIAAIICIITIIKYKAKGLAVSLCSCGYIALYLLILRFANVVISLDGIFAVLLSFILNHVFNIILLNYLKKNVDKSYEEAIKKYAIVILPVLILSVVFAFSGWMSIASFGMVIFWGLVVSIIYSAILTRTFIKNM